MVKSLAILGIFFVTSSWGLSFENIRVQKDDDKIIIIYDLVCIDPGSNVNVRVFSSTNDYRVPIKNAIGDIGSVLPGPNKRIIWPVGEAIAVDYQGILFKFDGRTFPGWKIINPSEKGLVRGKKNTIQWQGGFIDDEVSILLIKPGIDTVDRIGQTKNTGNYIWKTPKKLKPGSGYVLRLTCGDNATEYRFSIKRKFL